MTLPNNSAITNYISIISSVISSHLLAKSIVETYPSIVITSEQIS